MREKEKMIKGELYYSFGEELTADRERVKATINRANYDWTLDQKEKQKLVLSSLGSHKENAYIETPVYFDYGYNVHVGKNFYANFSCVFLDGTTIQIGDNVMVGPRVSFYTACHPIDKDVRNALLEYSKPIVIGNDVWIGGDCVINPGVTIGSNVVIGSGSVVTRNIPNDVIAAGNPCKVIRAITNDDKAYWEQRVKEK